MPDVLFMGGPLTGDVLDVAPMPGANMPPMEYIVRSTYIPAEDAEAYTVGDRLQLPADMFDSLPVYRYMRERNWVENMWLYVWEEWR